MTIGYTAEEFAKVHDHSQDVEKRIRKALAELGPDKWAYEREFLKLAGVNNHQAVESRDKFAGHHIEVKDPYSKRRRVWCGSVELAERLRKIVG